MNGFSILRAAAIALAAGGLLMLGLCGCFRSKEPQKTDDPSTRGEQATLAFSSFDGGGPEYSVRIDDPSVVSCTSERRYAKANHAELDGAGYKVIFTFKGLKAGTTRVTVSSASPIAEEDDRVYTVTVDDALRVTLREQEAPPQNALKPVPTLVLLAQDVTFYPDIADSASASAFIERLSSEQIEVVLQEDGGGLLCGDLPWEIPQGSASATAQPGDVLLLEDGRLAVCTQPTDGTFTHLASVDSEQTQQLLQALRDAPTVTLWVEWSE